MKFQMLVTDVVDLGILHETLHHLMTDHPPMQMKITIEFDNDSDEWGDSPHPPPEWSPNATSSPLPSTEIPLKTEEVIPEHPKSDEDK